MRLHVNIGEYADETICGGREAREQCFGLRSTREILAANLKFFGITNFK